MKIKERLLNCKDMDALLKDGAINIVCFGDSITHGGLGFNQIHYETTYWHRLKKKLSTVNDYVPINMINSGIGGSATRHAVNRIERDVLCYHPDLVIICFGLNEVTKPLEVFMRSLTTIFETIGNKGYEMIFMTPNMQNTYVHKKTPKQYREYAMETAHYQNSGIMDEYVQASINLAKKHNIPVCDCYAEWKKMAQEGIDTTDLLANYVNHPKRKMHKLFADKLFDVIMNT